MPKVIIRGKGTFWTDDIAKLDESKKTSLGVYVYDENDAPLNLISMTENFDWVGRGSNARKEYSIEAISAQIKEKYSELLSDLEKIKKGPKKALKTRSRA